MKDRIVIDIGQMLDEIFEATQNFGDALKNGFPFGKQEKDAPFHWDGDVDYYPRFSYPPANVYITADRTMVLEFALAGFSEADIDLQFQGDYLVLNVKAPEAGAEEGEVRYFKRRLKLKSVEDQRYYVPEDKFDQEGVKATYRNGLLRVRIPGREMTKNREGVKVDIVVESDEKEAEV